MLTISIICMIRGKCGTNNHHSILSNQWMVLLASMPTISIYLKLWLAYSVENYILYFSAKAWVNLLIDC